MKHQKIALMAVILTTVAFGAAGPDSGPQRVPVAELGSRFTLIGQLEKPLGTYMNIEGTAHVQPMMMSNPFDVDTVDGVKLAKPLLLQVRGVKNIPAGTRCVFRGYESGSMENPPEDPQHKEVPVQQGTYHFAAWFEITEVKTPATLERVR